MRPFSWENEMINAEKKMAKNILIYEKTAKGKKAMELKADLLALKKRRTDLFD